MPDELRIFGHRIPPLRVGVWQVDIGGIRIRLTPKTVLHPEVGQHPGWMGQAFMGQKSVSLVMVIKASMSEVIKGLEDELLTLYQSLEGLIPPTEPLEGESD